MKTAGYTAELRDGVIHVVKPDGSFYRIRGGKCECVAGKRGKDCKHLMIAKAQLGTLDVAGPNSFKKKMSLADGQALADSFLSLLPLRRGFFRLQIAGSIRREKQEIGDLDILGIRLKGYDHHMIADALSQDPDVVIKSGTGDSSTGWSLTLTYKGQQINLLMLSHEQSASWSAALVYATGNTKLNIALRALARANGDCLNQYGLDLADGTRKTFPTEADLFAHFGLQAVPPAERTLESTKKDAVAAFWKRWAK